MKSVLRIFFIVAPLIPPIISLSQLNKRALIPEDIVGIRDVSDPRISPNAKLVAFVVTEPNDTSKPEQPQNSDIWIVPSDGSSAPHKYALGPKQELMPRWSPDGKYLAFLSNRGEGEKNQIYLLQTAGGEAEQVTTLKENVDMFRWLPDSRTIAFTLKDSLSGEEEKKQKAKHDERIIDKNVKFNRLYEVDVTTCKVRLVSNENEHVNDFDHSPDGKQYVLNVSPTPKIDDIYFNSYLVIINKTDSSRKVLTKHSFGNVRWSPDGKQIVFFSPVGKQITGLPTLISPSGSGKRILAEDYHGMVLEMEWMTDSKSLLVVAQEGVQATIGKFDIASNTFKRLKSVGRGISSSLWWNRNFDGSLIAFTEATTSSPADVWIMKSDGSNAKRLTTLNPQADSLTYGSIESVRWKSKDGTAIEGLLIRPVNYMQGHRYPTVVQVHGGPEWQWWIGWLNSWHEWAQLLANNGYAVLLPNIRGSDGYGWKFVEENFSDWGGKDFEDIVSGVDYLIKEGIADSERLGIGGWSYGGFTTAWAVSQTNRFKAAVMGAGISNLISFYGTSDIPTFMKVYFGSHPFDRREVYEQHSALTFIKKIGTPTLILHGDADLRVPISQSYEFYQGLRDMGIETQMIVYPRESHHFGERAHQVDLLYRVLNWYNKHLGAK